MLFLFFQSGCVVGTNKHHSLWNCCIPFGLVPSCSPQVAATSSQDSLRSRNDLILESLRSAMGCLEQVPWGAPVPSTHWMALTHTHSHSHPHSLTHLHPTPCHSLLDVIYVFTSMARGTLHTRGWTSILRADESKFGCPYNNHVNKRSSP